MHTPPWRAAAAVLPQVVEALLLVARRVSLGEAAVEHERHERLHHLLEVGPHLLPCGALRREEQSLGRKGGRGRGGGQARGRRPKAERRRDGQSLSKLCARTPLFPSRLLKPVAFVLLRASCFVLRSAAESTAGKENWKTRNVHTVRCCSAGGGLRRPAQDHDRAPLRVEPRCHEAFASETVLHQSSLPHLRQGRLLSGRSGGRRARPCRPGHDRNASCSHLLWHRLSCW